MPDRSFLVFFFPLLSLSEMYWPWGVPRRIVNSSSRDSLTLLSVRVHRRVAGLTRLRSVEAVGQTVSYEEQKGWK